MSAEIVQFIPKARNRRPDTDFPTIVFRAPLVLRNAHERELYDYAPSDYVAPEQDPA